MIEKLRVPKFLSFSSFDYNLTISQSPRGRPYVTALLFLSHGDVDDDVGVARLLQCWETKYVCSEGYVGKQ